MDFVTEGAAQRSGPPPYNTGSDVNGTAPTMAPFPVLMGATGHAYRMRSANGCATYKIRNAPLIPGSPVLGSAMVLLDPVLGGLECKVLSLKGQSNDTFKGP